MTIKTPLYGLRNPFKFGLRGVGPSLPITPVLSAFGAGSIDDLELDPPAIFIEHNISGTLTGDFHSSATPPAKEAGDIGFFITSLSGDAVTDISTALNTFLDLHPGETGYLHFRLTNGAGDSNVITTQVITVPSAGTILLQTSDFDTSWLKTGASITADATTDPDGGSLADALVESAASGTHFTRRDNFFTSVAGREYRLSVSAKPNGRNWLFVEMTVTNFKAGVTAYFDISTGAVGTTGAGVTSASIVAETGGWYRCEIVVTADNSGVGSDVLLFAANGNGVNSYTGNGTSGVYLYDVVLREFA